MKKTAVLLYPMFSEYELSVALSVLSQGGKEITTLGLARAPIRGESGLTCLPDEAYAEADPDAFDSVLLPGMMRLLTEEEEIACVGFVRQIAAREGAVIAAISLAPYLLAKAGVLAGRKFTVGMYEEDMDEMGVFEKENLIQEDLVVDGNVITAVGSSFIPFGLALGKALGLSFAPGWFGV